MWVICVSVVLEYVFCCISGHVVVVIVVLVVVASGRTIMYCAIKVVGLTVL